MEQVKDLHVMGTRHSAELGSIPEMVRGCGGVGFGHEWVVSLTSDAWRCRAHASGTVGATLCFGSLSRFAWAAGGWYVAAWAVCCGFRVWGLGCGVLGKRILNFRCKV